MPSHDSAGIAGGETTSSLLRFYRDGRDNRGRSLDEMIQASDAWLEATHDYIQWAFPLPDRSAFNSSAPVLVAADIAAFRSDPVLRDKLLRMAGRMFAFYGFAQATTSIDGSDNTGALARAPSFEHAARNWLQPGNHNFLRMTRILSSLRLLGCPEEAGIFMAALEAVARLQEGSVIGSRTMAYWRGAAARQLALAATRCCVIILDEPHHVEWLDNLLIEAGVQLSQADPLSRRRQALFRRTNMDQHNTHLNGSASAGLDDTPTPVRFDLLTENAVYKPFRYPWAYEAWLTQQRVHWLPEEVPLADDVKDWHRNLTDAERNLVTQIFRFFTQSDVEVNNCYMKHYSQVFKPTEVLMMLSAFSNIETVHIAAYSHLLDTIGMPEIEYQAFRRFKEMKDKYDYMQSFRMDSKHEIAKTLAAFGAFTEGLQLFASFAILLNFPRFNKLKGMGQIVSWSVRDETLHCLSIIKLFRTFIQENPEIWTEDLRREIYLTCATIVDHEDAFIDLAFELGPVDGLNAEQVKSYIRFIADRRLMQLGLSPLFHVERNPLPWLDDMLNAPEHANFFENRSTEYSKASTAGTWEEAFDISRVATASVNTYNAD